MTSATNHRAKIVVAPGDLERHLDLPPGVRVTGFHTSDDPHLLHIQVDHPDFPDIPEHSALPYVDLGRTMRESITWEGNRYHRDIRTTHTGEPLTAETMAADLHDRLGIPRENPDA